VWPLFAGFSFFLKIIHKIFFAWWLDSLLQRRANKALWDDIQTNLHFLYTTGEPVREERTRILPFDYASVYIDFGNVRFCFARGRDELSVSLSPRIALKETYELSVVIAAFDLKDIADVAPLNSLAEVNDLLQTRLHDLNRAFSESQYPEFKTRLMKVKEGERILTRQAEWELNKRLYC
jgi:hypothetical protein